MNSEFGIIIVGLVFIYILILLNDRNNRKGKK